METSLLNSPIFSDDKQLIDLIHILAFDQEQGIFVLTKNLFGT